MGDTSSSWIIVVHCGAGWHNRNKRKAYKQSLEKACLEAALILQNSNSDSDTWSECLDATKAALQILEDDPLSNAGLGSALNINGNVEMDCSMMDGKTGGFGSVGGITSVENPSSVVHHILKNSISLLPLGRIPPMYVFFLIYFDFSIVLHPITY